MPWSESFSLGHRELDAQHRSMVELINRACLARDAESRLRLLAELERVTETHFECEEMVLEQLYRAAPKERRMLRDTLSAALIEHAAGHRLRLAEVRAMSHALGTETDAGGAKFGDELRAWFVGHAIGADAQLKTALQSA